MTSTKPDPLEDVSTEQLRRELSDGLRDVNEQLKRIASLQRKLAEREKQLRYLH